MATVRDAVERATAGLRTLADLGETIDDEWQYVTDLEAAWRGRLDEIAAARGAEPLADDADGAIDALCAEAGRIEDPHRAIDWLSTFPQAALAALGETT